MEIEASIYKGTRYITRNWTDSEIQSVLIYAELIQGEFWKLFCYPPEYPKKEVIEHVKSWVNHKRYNDWAWQINKEFLDEVESLNIITIIHNEYNKNI